MKAYIEGTIKLINENSFKDAKTGEPVVFNTLFIQGEDSKVIQLNTRQDFAKFIDRNAVITLDVLPDFNSTTKFRIKIIDVKPA